MNTITYEDFFAIMKIAFYADQKDIAECLGSKDWNITRMKQGKIPPIASSKIYESVLDPQKSKLTHIKNRKEEDCLYDLKEIIKEFFDNVYEAMYHCWEEKDYKTFALKLLDRARCGTLISSSEDSSLIPDLIFVSSADNFVIKDYLHSDLKNTLSSSYVSALHLFLEEIRDCLTDATHFKKAREQKSIKKFIETLNGFLVYLLGKPIRSEIACLSFKAPNLLNTAFWDEAERRQKELLPLFEDVYTRAMDNCTNFWDDYSDITPNEHPGELE